MASLRNRHRHLGAAVRLKGTDAVRPVFFQKAPKEIITKEHRACWGHVLEEIVLPGVEKRKGDWTGKFHKEDGI